MKLIVGLGNPGKEYQNTRHNIGFMAIDKLAAKFNASTWQEKKNYVQAECLSVISEKILLLKPLTYMNLSGDAVQAVMNWYKLSLDDIIVIYDDLDLEIGRIRLRQKGSSAGHKGIESIIYTLNSDVFKRIKIGIGRPSNKNFAINNFVLSKFSSEEESLINEALEKTCDAVECILKKDIISAMNIFNPNESKN
ncbi:aminoacyl-tRNA hydrolase [Selenomonadales bacterium OttesenSCG-928-I06]|nr:aminoacyl-tRNA hydrolase [Selenomonadales bacterium OttesenSCG-928-I06]